MINKMSTALLIVMLTIGQPMLFAQGGMPTIDLGNASDDELTRALDAATQLELIMRSDWEPAQLDAAPTDIMTQEPALAGTAPESPDYATEEPALIGAEPEYPDYMVQEPTPEPEVTTESPDYIVEETPETTEEIPENGYFEESQRFLALAQEAFERGDYEAAATYALEASRYAELSGENIGTTQADESPAYTETAPTPDADGYYPLPATFTVRRWVVYGDSLWNIAALPEIYGDPYKWPVLFEANRQIMPEPNNPNLIEPGMILEIPSLGGETREGVWQNDRLYVRR